MVKLLIIGVERVTQKRITWHEEVVNKFSSILDIKRLTVLGTLRLTTESINGSGTIDNHFTYYWYR